MIRHITTLIWNQKRKHLGLSFEIFFSFMVLFAVFSFCLNQFQWYFEPLGFEYEHVWLLEIDSNDASEEEVNLTREQLSHQLSSYPEVETFAYSYANVPFSFSTNSWGLEKDEISFDADRFSVTDKYFQTLGIEILEGRGFGPEDDGAAIEPIIITKHTRERLFGKEQAVGQVVFAMNSEREFKIIGVVNDYRYKGDFGEIRPAFFQRLVQDPWMNFLLVKTTDRADAIFESKLLKDLSLIATGWSIDIDYLTDMRDNKLTLNLVPVLIFTIISAFLIFNVSLGLFGVLWQNISKRRQEIGVRRSMGSTRGEISFQFVVEILVLASLSLIFGIFFAIQFPLLNIFEIAAEVYLWSILLAILSIYLLVFLCAYFPSAQAAKLHPAVALRED